MKAGLFKILLIILISMNLVSCQQGIFDDAQMQQLGYEKNNETAENNDDILDIGPVKGGNLNLFTTTPDTFNPLLTKNKYVNDFLGLIYEGLVKLDEKQMPAPVLSESWSISADGLIWNFKIREGINWSDGNTFTAEDVAFTVKSLLESKTDSVYSILLQNIAAYSAVDDYDFKLVLKKPNSFTAEMMTFPIIHYLE